MSLFYYIVVANTCLKKTTRKVIEHDLSYEFAFLILELKIIDIDLKLFKIDSSSLFTNFNGCFYSFLNSFFPCFPDFLCLPSLLLPFFLYLAQVIRGILTISATYFSNNLLITTYLVLSISIVLYFINEALTKLINVSNLLPF